MIDFHSHILPGMDDGSKSVDESMAMLEMLSQQGVETVVATPHFYANHESVQKFLQRRSASYEKLMCAVSDDMPKVLLGAEIRFYPGIGNLQGLKDLCIQGSNLLLLEMPFSKWTGYTVKEVIDITCSRSVTVALAHIDRYLSYQSNDVWRQLADNDILMQVNAEFFEGVMSRARAMRMLRSGLVHMLGSDCHNLTDRAPNIGVAVDRIRKKFGDGFLEYFSDIGKSLIVLN